MRTTGKIQECLDSETYCERRAASAIDVTVKMAFAQCARCWHELALCWRELSRVPALRETPPHEKRNGDYTPRRR